MEAQGSPNSNTPGRTGGRLLITGAGGLLGGRLARLLSGRFEVLAGRHTSPPPEGLPVVPLDLLSPASLAQAIDATRPNAVLHAAALADVDRCEREPERAFRVNVGGSETLARLCGSRGIRLILVSTDLVFRGERAFLREADTPGPLMVYARTKLEAEEAVLSRAGGSAVIRLALLQGCGYGPRGTASEAIAWELRAGRRLRLLTDQYRTPVDIDSVASATERLLRGDASGLYHLGGPERLSRHAFGLRVARVLGLSSHLIEAARRSERSSGAPRPADTSLDSERALRVLGWRPRTVDEAIRDSRLAPDIIRPI